jgi:predicted TPR repeat methyltransferase
MKPEYSLSNESIMPESVKMRSNDIENAFQRIRNIGLSGEVHKCAQLLKEFLQKHPNHLHAWGNLAYIHYATGRSEEAIRCYQKVCELNPEDVEARRRLGDCYYSLGQMKLARKAYLSLQGSPLFDSLEIQGRLAQTESVGLHILRRTIPLFRQFVARMAESEFRRALPKEATGLTRAIPGIRASGFRSYLTYLSRHYLLESAYRFRSAPCDLCEGTRFAAVYFVGSQKKVRCDRCGLEFVERKPPDGLDAFDGLFDDDATIEYFEAIWQDPVLLDARIQRLQSIFDRIGESFPRPGWRVLEIGCGQGHLLNLLKQKGMEVQGMEIAERLVHDCRDKFGLNVARGTIRQMPAFDSLFDVILAYHVLEHLDEPSNFFKKAQGLLKEGGFIFVEVPVPDLSRLSRLQQMNEVSGYANRSHLYHFRPDTLSAYFPKYGFDLVNTYFYLEESFPNGGFLGKKWKS